MNDNDKKNKQELPKLKDDKLVKNSKKKTLLGRENKNEPRHEIKRILKFHKPPINKRRVSHFRKK